MKFIVLLVLLSCVFTVNGQLLQNASDSTYKTYKLKQKRNRTAGLVLLTTGIGMTTTGFVISMSQPWFGPGATSSDNNKGMGLFYLGAAMSVSSVPFLIAAGKNKRKARLHLKDESYYIIPGAKATYAAVALKIPLNTR